MSLKRLSISFWGITAIGLAIWLFTVAKAYHMAFSLDESASYLDLHYMNIGYFFGSTANSHLLNSFFMKLSGSLFGYSPIVLRMHTLFFHVVYLVVAAGFSLKLRPSALQLPLFISLTLHPFVLDYFSMARGYGPAVSLAMLCLWWLQKWMSSPKKYRYLRAAMVAANLSLIANYSFIYFLLSFWAVVGLVYIEKNGFRRLWLLPISWKWPDRLLAIGQLIGLAVVLLMLFRLRGLGRFWEGGRSGFWVDTVSSMVDSLLYDATYAGQWHTALVGWVALVYVATGLMAARQWWESRSLSFMASLWLLTSTAALGSLVQLWLLNGLLLTNRTALLFCPLFFLLMAFGLAECYKLMARYSLTKYGTVVLTYLVAAGLAIHSAYTANLSWDLHYRHTADVPKVMAKLSDIAALDITKEPFTVGLNHELVYSYNFYKLTGHWPQLNLAAWRIDYKNDESRFYFDSVPTADYQFYYLSKESEDWEEVQARYSLEVVEYFPVSDTYLLKVTED